MHIFVLNYRFLVALGVKSLALWALPSAPALSLDTRQFGYEDAIEILNRFYDAIDDLDSKANSSTFKIADKAVALSHNVDAIFAFVRDCPSSDNLGQVAG